MTDIPGDLFVIVDPSNWKRLKEEDKFKCVSHRKQAAEQGRLAHKDQMGQAHPKNFR